MPLSLKIAHAPISGTTSQKARYSCNGVAMSPTWEKRSTSQCAYLILSKTMVYLSAPALRSSNVALVLHEKHLWLWKTLLERSKEAGSQEQPGGKVGSQREVTMEIELLNTNMSWLIHTLCNLRYFITLFSTNRARKNRHSLHANLNLERPDAENDVQTSTNRAHNEAHF